MRSVKEICALTVSDQPCRNAMTLSENSRVPLGSASVFVKARRCWAPHSLLATCVAVRGCSVNAVLPEYRAFDTERVGTSVRTDAVFHGSHHTLVVHEDKRKDFHDAFPSLPNRSCTKNYFLEFRFRHDTRLSVNSHPPSRALTEQNPHTFSSPPELIIDTCSLPPKTIVLFVALGYPYPELQRNRRITQCGRSRVTTMNDT